MSSLWTPGGEHPVGREPSERAPREAAPGAPPDGGGPTGERMPTDEELAELRDQLARTPATVVVANHCLGLWELAALHLSLRPPQLDQAAVAIDALGAIVERLEGRLGEEEPTLREGLAQLRLAFVQVKAAGEDTT
ncbi:MAG TPA: hypothetical protein VMU14_14505 [Acidimicrobiales bacterium]|nr:hypothetical protein [Acidimicrobiales bacterium]